MNSNQCVELEVVINDPEVIEVIDYLAGICEISPDDMASLIIKNYVNSKAFASI